MKHNNKIASRKKSSWSNFFIKFKQQKRGVLSFFLLIVIFVITSCAEIIANDKPIIVYYQGDLFFPIIKNYSEKEFDGEFDIEADYNDPYLQEIINNNGWMVFPLIRYSYKTIRYDLPAPAPTPPDSENWLGTDDQGRDVLARLIYGYRISLFFGLALAFISCVIGVVVGAIQGYYGGKIDLFGRRFVEIWSSLPVLYVIIIISSLYKPNLFALLGILILFSWMVMVDFVRAESLKVRNYTYVKAAKALGVSDYRIIWRHILPNATISALAIMPFVINQSIISLTTLDFLGFGLPLGSPSLGELISQSKNNLHAPWLGITAFLSISFLLVLLIFFAEAVRNSLKPGATPIKNI